MVATVSAVGLTGGEIVQGGVTVRAIEYEMVPVGRAARMSLAALGVQEHLGNATQVAVLRCVDDHGERLTAFGDSDHLQRLLDSGEASDPAGMTLCRETFPVVLEGWLPHPV
jgi:hypothetical protein